MLDLEPPPRQDRDVNSKGWRMWFYNLWDEVVNRVKTLAELALEGKVFYGNDLILPLGISATQDYLIITGAKEAALALEFRHLGAYQVLIYEGTTVSANGAVLTNFNMRRSDTTHTVATLVYRTPTVTVVGTRIVASINPAGEKKDAALADGSGALILNKNTNYLVRITDTSAAAADLDFAWRLVEDFN